MSVANAYAKALFESASEQSTSKEDLDRIERELGEFEKFIYAEPLLKTALIGPVVTAKEKTQIVNELATRAGFHPLSTAFIALLARKGRVPVLPAIREAFLRVSLESQGGILGYLVSADPLEPKDVDGLTRVFGAKLGKAVTFKVKTDPSLLAGLKVSVGGVTYDGTLRAQLQRLREQFVNENETIQ